MVTRDFTAPYSRLESYVYDRFIAPASTAFVDRLRDRELAELPGEARLLDVGCGGGQNALSLARHRPDLAITGLDRSADQIRRARHRGQNAGLAVEFVEGSALDLPFDEADFDAVISIASIKHWPDPARGLSECVRVLRPGGRLLVAEADRGCYLDDARSFVARTGVPRPVLPVALAAFRTFVAGRGIDLDEARALVAGLPLTDTRVARLEGTPALVIRGVRT